MEANIFSIMKLTTALAIEQQPNFFINHSQSLVSIGSCFSNLISIKLSELKFDIYNNP